MALRVSKKSVEYLIYLLFWGVLMLSPFIGGIISSSGFTFKWDQILAFWIYLIPIAVLFVLNNNVFMPFLLYKKKGRYYLLYLICVLASCSLLYIFSPEADKRPDMRHPRHDGIVRDRSPRGPRKEVLPFFYGRQRTIHDKFFNENVYEVRMRPMDSDRKFLMSFSNPGSMQLLLAVFVLIFNICIRLSFFMLHREEMFIELEKEKAKTELDYLKYQINPHFFMNTLNNIYALIDIDRVKAQQCVIKLSKMMRYVLYDATSGLVPIEKELVFLRSYIDLMRLRYTDLLSIEFNFSGGIAGVQIPSLLFVIFVENAFKHGVTYKQKSTINIDIFIDSFGKELMFKCRNTVNGDNKECGNEKKPGIGVENAKKRLELLYGGNAKLDVKKEQNFYSVELKIPLVYDKMYYY